MYTLLLRSCLLCSTDSLYPNLLSSNQGGSKGLLERVDHVAVHADLSLELVIASLLLAIAIDRELMMNQQRLF